MKRDHTAVPAFVRKTKAKDICAHCWRPENGHHYIVLNGDGKCWKCTPSLNRQRHSYSREELK